MLQPILCLSPSFYFRSSFKKLKEFLICTFPLIPTPATAQIVEFIQRFLFISLPLRNHFIRLSRNLYRKEQPAINFGSKGALLLWVDQCR
jgi:hypothetical protein